MATRYSEMSTLLTRAVNVNITEAQQNTHFFQKINSDEVMIKSPHTILKKSEFQVREPIMYSMVWRDK